MHALCAAAIIVSLTIIAAPSSAGPSPAPSAIVAPLAAPSALVAPAPAAAASFAPSAGPSGALAPAPFTPETIPTEPPELQQMRARMEAQMERNSAQMRASQVALRHTILALLTPIQRATVATVIGELAIAPDPDVAAGARRIDATLSPAQRQAVLGAISAEAIEREKLFAATVAQTQTFMSQFEGGGAPSMPTLAPRVPAAGTVRVQSATAFALPGPALAWPMAPNVTAGDALIGLLVAPSWMGTVPAPRIIRTDGPAAPAGPR